MEAILTKHILAVVEIPNFLPLEKMADELEIAIDGIKFKKEDTGRFEEVPAFIAEDTNSSAKFVLFGIPEGEFGDAYTLEFSAETDMPMREFKKSTLKFLSSFLNERATNSRGFLDYSDDLADALNTKGIKTCKLT